MHIYLNQSQRAIEYLVASFEQLILYDLRNFNRWNDSISIVLMAVKQKFSIANLIQQTDLNVAFIRAYNRLSRIM